MSRRVILVFLAVVVLLLPACGSKTGEASAFNDQDVEFASAMIPHHQQAIAMSELAKSNASNADVKTLAAQIEAEQGPEITRMHGWLSSWNKSANEHSAMMHSMPGMMDDAALRDMGRLMGADFDRRFLESMIDHHEGAVTMAKDEQAQGKFTDAKALADQIVATQRDEIEQMQNLLDQL